MNAALNCSRGAERTEGDNSLVGAGQTQKNSEMDELLLHGVSQTDITATQNQHTP
jgi:hypothetical protein